MILYVQTAFLGDLLLSIPTLQHLRKLYPGQPIHLLCRKNLGGLLLKLGIVDVVYDQFAKDKPSLAEARQLLAGKKFDLVVCPHESFRSQMICWGVSATQKIGYYKPWNFFIFDERPRRPMAWPEVLRQLRLLETFDSELREHLRSIEGLRAPAVPVEPWNTMTLSRVPKAAIRERYGWGEQPVVALAPGSVWPTKRWGEAKYAELSGLLLERGVRVVLIGSPQEKNLSDGISTLHPEVMNLTGQTSLTELYDVIAASDVVVCNDSGAMHMASLAGTPTVALFGPTVLEFGYQPWSSRAVVLENKTLSCRPCSSHGTQRCPIGTHECMTSIAPVDVATQVQKFLYQGSI